tara:strand:- start:29 stop:331 length:303 start_codon:yes stop_codon:yes gene_type:complete
MSALINFSINLEKLSKQKFVKGKSGVWVNLTMSVNDETNSFGQNTAIFDSQSKEERDAKKDRNYVGNGNVVFTDGNCVKSVRQDESPAKAVAVASDDLPF